MDDQMEFDLQTKRLYSDFAILGRIFSFLMPYLFRFILAVVGTTLATVLILFEPKVLEMALRVIKEPGTTFLNIFLVGLLYFGLLLTSCTLSFFAGIELQKIGQRVIFDVRREVFSKIELLSISQLNSIPLGKYVSRVTNDTNSLSDLFTNILINLMNEIISIITILIIVLIVSWKVGLVLFCFLPLIIVLTIVYKNIARKIHRDVRSQVSSMNAFLNENISGMTTTQIFNQEERKADEFKSVNNKLLKANERQVFAISIFRPLTYLLFAICLGISLFFIVRDIQAEVLALESLFMLYLYISQFFGPIQQLADQFNSLQASFASSERILQILDMKTVLEENYGAEPTGRFKGKIEFRHVWFSYLPNEWVLKDVSFIVNPNETAAFVGATGAGKSTIIGLIVRNYDIQKGDIFIDDVNIKEYSLLSLRKQIGEMLQDVFLFTGTIGTNIKLDDETITDEEMIEACQYVGASEFIEKLPQKYNEVVRERGNNFSMGQKQLLSFARVICYKPAIMLLDEATSNIDTETEQQIQKSLEKMMKVGTMIIVAHRLSTIQHSDKIFVLSHGEIIEEGNHQELLKQKGHYYQLYKLQFLKKNL